MKRIYSFSALLCLYLNTSAQLAKSDAYIEGMHSLQGISRPYDPVSARNNLQQSALAGNAQAMTQLGHLYKKQTTGFQSLDSAVYWYKAAVNAGGAEAHLLLGRFYQTSTGIHQDFVAAAKAYQEGIAGGSKSCKNALAYLYYKGLGVEQNYNTAFALFKESAEDGLSNSMYFLGLCYRNGYGTSADGEKAKYWLREAGMEGEKNAIHELYKESIPENRSIVSDQLQEQLKRIQNYAGKYKTDVNNNYEGLYEGVAIYYDWSGKYVAEIMPLTLSLNKTATGYDGAWNEGDSKTAFIGMKSLENKFVFDNRSVYTRIDRYSGRKEESWKFNNAELDLSFMNDSIQLSGFVRFFSPKRNEPGKPLRIFLKRKIETLAGVDVKRSELKLFPNPAATHATLQFKIFNTATVGVHVFTTNGTLVWRENQQKLPAGTYSVSLPTSKLLPGTYVVQLMVDTKAESIVLIKQ